MEHGDNILVYASGPHVSLGYHPIRCSEDEGTQLDGVNAEIEKGSSTFREIEEPVARVDLNPGAQISLNQEWLTDAPFAE